MHIWSSPGEGGSLINQNKSVTKEKGVKDGEREGSIERRGAFFLGTQEEQPSIIVWMEVKQKESGGEN